MWNKGVEGARQYNALWSLPTISLAIQALESGHETKRGGGYLCCWFEVERIATDLMEWVEKHETGVKVMTEELAP